MAVKLEGKCSVIPREEGDSFVSGTLRITPKIGRTIGAEAISLRTLAFSPGLSPSILTGEGDDVLYLLEDLDSHDIESQAVTVFIDGWSYEIGSRTGLYLRPGQTLTVNNTLTEPIIFVSSQCPEPATRTSLGEPSVSPKAGTSEPERLPIVRLADRETIPTGDRWYRVLVDDEVGSLQVTQFIGSIPPGRAPDHFHTYEEVLFILRGRGRMWAGDAHTEIGPGSSVYLPKRQVHCVENTGTEELRLLGIFYPAGSPSVRYET